MTLQYPESEAVPLKTDPDGTVRVKGTRVILELVIDAFNEGASAEEIVSRYTTLQLADVYSVIAFYLHHQSEVDSYLIERGVEAEEIIREIKSRQVGLRERLLARQANKGN